MALNNESKQRRFLSVETGDQVTDLRNDGSLVRVMQWNILADALSYSSPTENFIKCSQDVLSWAVRRERILDQILLYSPDLICLEEVDHFHDYFSPKLKERGYSCYFAAKPDSPCLRVPGHTSPDGCAMFVKNDRLQFTEVFGISLQDDVGNVTNQVAILAVVNDLVTKRPFLASTCHLKAKQNNGLLRAAQGAFLLGRIKQIQLEKGSSPVILCGDFNATPDEPVYYEMVNSGLTSSYVTATQDEAPFTTWKFRPSGEVRHTIDYIWHSSNIVLHNYLEIPLPDIIGCAGLPTVDYPSDHLLLVVDFKLPS